MKIDDVDSGKEALDSITSLNQPLLLSEHVRFAIREYITQLDGEVVGNLYGMVLNEVERPLIQTVLEVCDYNQSKAAIMLGLSRSTLRKKISIYGPMI
jgi:Fis family transcriptional regulator